MCETRDIRDITSESDI